MKFFKLCIDAGRRKKFAWAFPPFETDYVLVECSACGRKWNDCREGMENNIPYPIAFSNNYFPDFMCCHSINLVSQKLKEIIENSGMQVAKFAEMPVIGKSEFTKEQIKELYEEGYNVNKLHDEKPIYYRFGSVVGANLHKDSNVIWMESGEYRCKYCGYGVGYKKRDYFAPEYIELSSWDGNDLFKVQEFAGTIYCTEKFKELCEKSEITGIQFEEIEAR